MTGGAAVVNPGDFAAYVFIVVAAVGSVSVLGAIARRIYGGRGGRSVIGMHLGDTDPGSQQAVAQLAADIESLRDEVTGLRRELDEAQNRLDFTERLLAQARERGLLNAPKER